MLRYAYLLVLFSWASLMTILSLVEINAPSSIAKVQMIDKIVHFIFHFGLVGLLLMFSVQKTIKNKIVLSVFLSFVFGLIIEALQHILTDNRYADVLDVLANSFGAFTAAIFFWFLRRKKLLKKR